MQNLHTLNLNLLNYIEKSLSLQTEMYLQTIESPRLLLVYKRVLKLFIYSASLSPLRPSILPGLQPQNGASHPVKKSPTRVRRLLR